MLLEMLLGMLLWIDRVGIGTMSYVAFLKMKLPIRPGVLQSNCVVLPFLHLIGTDEVLLCSFTMVDGPGSI
jgi:hypothetical protein